MKIMNNVVLIVGIYVRNQSNIISYVYCKYKSAIKVNVVYVVTYFSMT